MEKEKLETILRIVSGVVGVRTKIFMTAVKLVFVLALTLMLFIGVQVGRVVQVMLG